MPLSTLRPIVVREKLPPNVLCVGVKLATGTTLMVANEDRVTAEEERKINQSTLRKSRGIRNV